MSTSIARLPAPTPAPRLERDARALYFALLDQAPDAAPAARAFLDRQLEAAAALPCALPACPAALDAWIQDGAARVGAEYRDYLAARRQGAPRRYFRHKAHAQHFLRGVAPTKRVDGAWLYGLLAHWRDARVRPLIQTYLEELGDGEPTLNHVALYRELLASQGCDDWAGLPPGHFVQGAIQLALAQEAAHRLPEVIGFNLGYEQLPLHLLITAYELAELGIDPYYFTLHVTVDNAHSGHACKAVQALLDACPTLGDRERFLARVRDGYRLNALGTGTLAVIEGFDARTEVIAMLAAKAPLGSLLHSDHCRFDGLTVNQWLAEPARVPTFLEALERRGWIRLGQDPAQSRFWQLVAGERAPMYGVFSPHEQQLLHDWIAGDAATPRHRPARLTPRRLGSTADAAAPRADDFDEEVRLLQRALAPLPDRAARLDRLVPLLAPAHHATPAGLYATRTFARLFNAPHAHG